MARAAMIAMFTAYRRRWDRLPGIPFRVWAISLEGPVRSNVVTNRQWTPELTIDADHCSFAGNSARSHDWSNMAERRCSASQTVDSGPWPSSECAEAARLGRG